jgi:hypothetical protein
VAEAYRQTVEADLADRPPAEGGDRGALALAGRRGQFADIGEEHADRVGGEVGEFAVTVCGELEEVAAVGADGVGGGVRVRPEQSQRGGPVEGERLRPGGQFQGEGDELALGEPVQVQVSQPDDGPHPERVL